MPLSIAVAGGLTTRDDWTSSTIASSGSMTARPSAADALLRLPLVRGAAAELILGSGLSAIRASLASSAARKAVGFEHRFQQRRRRESAEQLDI